MPTDRNQFEDEIGNEAFYSANAASPTSMADALKACLSVNNKPSKEVRDLGENYTWDDIFNLESGLGFKMNIPSGTQQMLKRYFAVPRKIGEETLGG